MEAKEKGVSPMDSLSMPARRTAPLPKAPTWWRVGAATVLAIVGSVLANLALVAIGETAFPATKGYAHYRFSDWAALTVVGVLAAGFGWSIVVRVSSMARFVFLRLAIVGSLVLLLPDLWIWLQGDPGQAVLVLVAMHLAIALVTYNLLVRLAPVPVGKASADSAGRLVEPGRPNPDERNLGTSRTLG